MDVLWSPWRYDYITGSGKEKTGACVFCEILNSSARDEETFILERAEFNFVILNIYPYTTGHLLVVPYAHIADLDKADKKTTDEMMDLMKRCQTALAEEYKPDGFNLGMNLGKCAGAGIEHHLHWHVVPRWEGDNNFMPVIGETRVMPQHLHESYDRLKPYFQNLYA